VRTLLRALLRDFEYFATNKKSQFIPSSVKKTDFTRDWSEEWGRVRSGTGAAKG
jgi:hypothetical protein